MLLEYIGHYCSHNCATPSASYHNCATPSCHNCATPSASCHNCATPSASCHNCAIAITTGARGIFQVLAIVTKFGLWVDSSLSAVDMVDAVQPLHRACVQSWSRALEISELLMCIHTYKLMRHALPFMSQLIVWINCSCCCFVVTFSVQTLVSGDVIQHWKDLCTI